MRGRERLCRFFEVFDRQLADNEFVAGHHISVADITALCAIDFAKNRVETGIPEGHDNVRHWYQAVSARPSAAE